MPLSPHIAWLREHVGHQRLLLPSVAVLPQDKQGRVLLVFQADRQEWGTIGGAVEPDESPQDAAIRETHEEAGVEVALTGIWGVVGGPGYEITYPNGDVVAYVSTVYDARILSGTARPDGEETSDVAWWSMEELQQGRLHDDRAREGGLAGFARAMFTELGFLTPP